ncbi:antigen AG231 [Nymphon striatum]|nr:antigen AG231 [Nymphon striatum]
MPLKEGPKTINSHVLLFKIMVTLNRLPIKIISHAPLRKNDAIVHLFNFKVVNFKFHLKSTLYRHGTTIGLNRKGLSHYDYRKMSADKHKHINYRSGISASFIAMFHALPVSNSTEEEQITTMTEMETTEEHTEVSTESTEITNTPEELTTNSETTATSVTTEDPVSTKASVTTEDPVTTKASVTTEDSVTTKSSVTTETSVTTEGSVTTEDYVTTMETPTTTSSVNGLKSASWLIILTMLDEGLQIMFEELKTAIYERTRAVVELLPDYLTTRINKSRQVILSTKKL